MPNGLGDAGYSTGDLDGLVAGTMPQKRLMDLVPQEVGEQDMRQLFRDSMTLW